MMSIYKLLLVFLFSIGVTVNAYAVDYEYNYGNALVDAADSGNEYLVLSYMGKGISVNAKGSYGTTALMRASIRGHELIVRRLLEAGADVHAKDAGGATALHLAARTGNVGIVELLLQKGADPDSTDADGYTPLQRATQTQYVAVIDKMLKTGTADILQKNKEGLSAMDLAHKSKNPKVIETMATSVGKQSQQNMLQIPQSKIEKPENVSPAPVEEVKTESIAPVEQVVKSSSEIEPSSEQPPLNIVPQAQVNSKPKEAEDKKQSVVKDLREIVAKNKNNAVVAHSRNEVAVKNPEVEPKIEEAHTKVKVSVAEAIKIPDEVDLRDSTNKLSIKTYDNQPHDIIGTQPLSESVAETSQKIRTVTMEISSFESEEEGVGFWDKILKMDQFKGKAAELVEDRSDVVAKYVLRLNGFDKSAEVFEGCKLVKKKNSQVLCYVVHDIY